MYFDSFLSIFFSTIFLFSITYLVLFSLTQLDLTLLYLFKRKSFRQPIVAAEHWPRITIQLPVYNEQFVINRLLNSIAQLDYPKDRLEVQILDDSTDETTDLIKKWIASQGQQALRFLHIRRKNRIGFKAGALANGMLTCNGEFIAIFDADFIPPVDFLKRSSSLFSDSKIGVVQTRWTHLNEKQNLLTRLQAFGLDAHFTIEQNARMYAPSFLNFNGTAGIWRRACIEDAGGWSADTLTEDLDLSFRAQLKGWKIIYDDRIGCPAELPTTMTSVIRQQQRWNKGGAETLRKLFMPVLRSGASLRTKVHALFQLGSSSVFVALLLASLSSLGIFWIGPTPGLSGKLLEWGSFGFAGFLSVVIFYAVSGIINRQPFWWLIPVFLLLNMGLSLRHASAVFSGWLGIRTTFNRTPKFSYGYEHSLVSTGTYIKRLSISGWIEMLLGIIFLYTAWVGLTSGEDIFLMMHSMVGIGLISVSILLFTEK